MFFLSEAQGLVDNQSVVNEEEVMIVKHFTTVLVTETETRIFIFFFSFFLVGLFVLLT